MKKRLSVWIGALALTVPFIASASTGSITLVACNPFGGSQCETNGQSMTAPVSAHANVFWATSNIAGTCSLTNINTFDGTTITVGNQNPAPGWGFYVTKNPTNITLSCIDTSGNVVSASVSFNFGSQAPPSTITAPFIDLSPRSGLGTPEPEVAHIFDDMSKWPISAAHIRDYKIAEQWFAFNSDADITTLLNGLSANNIPLGLEAGMLTNNGACGKGEGFGAQDTLKELQLVKDHGGKVKYIYLDEVAYLGRANCGYTASQMAQDIAANVAKARAIFPDLVVGDEEPMAMLNNWPEPLALYEDFARYYELYSGTPLGFEMADVDWSNPNWPSSILAVERAFAGMNIPFGVIYNGYYADTSNVAWVSDAENHYTQYQAAGGHPVVASIQTWNNYPDHIIPETDGASLTSVFSAYVSQSQPSVALRVCYPIGGIQCAFNGGTLTVPYNSFVGAYWNTTNIPATASGCSYVSPGGDSLSVGPQNPAPGWGAHATISRDVTLNCMDAAQNVQSATVHINVQPVGTVAIRVCYPWGSNNCVGNDGSFNVPYKAFLGVGWSSSNIIGDCAYMQPDGTVINAGSNNPGSGWGNYALSTHDVWLHCLDGAGVVRSAAVHLNVSTTSPTASLSASPASINSGQSSTLTWTSTNAASCTPSGFTGSGTSGTMVVMPAITTMYSITCTGAGGLATATSSIFVAIPPISLSASPNPCTPAVGSSTCSTTLSWTAPNASSAQLTVQVNGGAQKSVTCSGAASSVNANWIVPNSMYVFNIYNVPTCGTDVSRMISSSTVKVTGVAFLTSDRVKAINAINVRASATTTSALVGTEPLGSLGTVVTGPVFNVNYWWQIIWDNGISGWTIQTNLTKVSS